MNSLQNKMTWPERFVYVCAATQGAPVNIAPMLSAGSGRVVGLVVLRAVNNPLEPTEAERAYAIAPGERLMQYGENNLGLSPENMKYFDGRSESFTDWTNALEPARELATAQNAEIVFNISGGPKPAVVGALLGAGKSGQGPKISLISFGLDSRVKWAYFDNNGQLAEAVLPSESHLSLASYLKSVGFAEIDADLRRKKERRMACEKASADAMFQKTLEQGRNNTKRMFRDLHAALGSLRYKGTPLQVDLNRNTRDFFGSIFTGLNNTETTINGITVKSEYDLEFLMGKWLESKVFNTISEIFRGRNDFEIACGLRFGSLPAGGAEKSIADISDFDLVILGSDRLEIVEAKAVVMPTQIHPSIAKLNSYIGRLGGDAGRAWIVAPLLEKWQLDKHDMITHAEGNGIRILYGRHALDILEREIRRSRRL